MMSRSTDSPSSGLTSPSSGCGRRRFGDAVFRTQNADGLDGVLTLKDFDTRAGLFGASQVLIQDLLALVAELRSPCRT